VMAAPPWHVAALHGLQAWWIRTRLNLRPARRRIREEVAGSLR
jgi:hypothetical protein